MPFFTTNKNKNTSLTTTRSNTSNTITPTPTITDTMVTDKHVIDNELNPTKSPSLTTADVGVPKDVREFEHGRQKAKKTLRTQIWREEKARLRRIKTGEFIVAPTSTKRSSRGGSGVRGQVLPGFRPDWEDSASVLDVEDAEFEELEMARSEALLRRRGAADHLRFEVDLTNLMKPAKARKGKQGAATGDFEVLPTVRQVVALDDRWDDEFEIDEPWEHLSVDGEADEKGISYAEVVSIAR